MKHLHLKPNFFDTDYAFMFPAGVSTEERKDMMELYRLRKRVLEIANKYNLLSNYTGCPACKPLESSRSKSDSIV